MVRKSALVQWFETILTTQLRTAMEKRSLSEKET